MSSLFSLWFQIFGIYVGLPGLVLLLFFVPAYGSDKDPESSPGRYSGLHATQVPLLAQRNVNIEAVKKSPGPRGPCDSGETWEEDDWSGRCIDEKGNVTAVYTIGLENLIVPPGSQNRGAVERGLQQ